VLSEAAQIVFGEEFFAEEGGWPTQALFWLEWACRQTGVENPWVPHTSRRSTLVCLANLWRDVWACPTVALASRRSH
ncbi:MAG: hypothetical protein ACREP9_13535, partial [Candidatus Dormibacteraceae bacterium]